MKLKTLLYYSLFCFVFMDLLSTIAATVHLCTFENEANGLLRAAYDMGGYLGVVLVKVCVASGMLALAYVCGRYVQGVEPWARGVLWGSILTGTFITISNFKILFTNSSLWIMNIDAATMSICIMVATTIIVTTYELFFKNTKKEISKNVLEI